MSYSIYDQDLHLRLTINMTPVGFMAGAASELYIDNRGTK